MSRQHAAKKNELAARYVYVIEDERGRVKIGISSSPKSRLSGLQTATAGQLRLRASVRVSGHGRAAALEQCAHQMLRPTRIRGEWFSADPELAIALVTLLERRDYEGALLLSEKAMAALELQNIEDELDDADPEDEDDLLDERQWHIGWLGRVTKDLLARGIRTSSWDDV